MTEPLADASLAEPGQPGIRAVAPAWHTVVVLLLLLGLSVLGTHQQSLPSVGHPHGHVPGYLVTMAIEWGLTGFIWLGIRGRGVRMVELIGGRWPSLWAVLRDLGIAVLFLIASNLVLSAVSHLLKATPGRGIRAILPNGPTEVALFVLLALTAGICEEILFRGYLQRQFAALTKSAAAGLTLQAIAFGAAHGYQGTKYMCIIAVYGCLFGLLAHWRRSLRPGMMAHCIQDAVGGLVGKHLLK